MTREKNTLWLNSSKHITTAKAITCEEESQVKKIFWTTELGYADKMTQCYAISNIHIFTPLWHLLWLCYFLLFIQMPQNKSWEKKPHFSRSHATCWIVYSSVYFNTTGCRTIFQCNANMADYGFKWVNFQKRTGCSDDEDLHEWEHQVAGVVLLVTGDPCYFFCGEF